MNTGNAIKIFDAGGGLKVTWAVPEKHIINFFGLILTWIQSKCLTICDASLSLATATISNRQYMAGGPINITINIVTIK